MRCQVRWFVVFCVALGVGCSSKQGSGPFSRPDSADGRESLDVDGISSLDSSGEPDAIVPVDGKPLPDVADAFSSSDLDAGNLDAEVHAGLDSTVPDLSDQSSQPDAGDTDDAEDLDHWTTDESSDVDVVDEDVTLADLSDVGNPDAVVPDCVVDGDCTDDDGDACNGVPVCVDGECVLTPDNAVICDSGADTACLKAVCQPIIGGCEPKPVADGSPCSDNNACTDSDGCLAGSCMAGVLLACDDGNLCTDDVCSPETGCLFTANLDSCDDGDACTVGDSCDEGQCVAGGAKDCNDNNVCTDDSCDPIVGCLHDENVVACDDGNACTANDECESGACLAGGEVNCDDGNVCTDDGCNAAEGCTHLFNELDCDDQDACTTLDACINGSCAGSENLDCDDGNPCTSDLCLPESGCVHVAKGGPCDDGNACTTEDSCQELACVGGAAVSCDDGNPCTEDSCLVAAGGVHVAMVEPCDDGNLCTTSDGCVEGACAGGPALDCDDGNPCTDDGCAPETGCFHDPNGNPCDDKDACTTGDICAAGKCFQGLAKVCDDKNPCTTDSCDPATGCVHGFTDGGCDDGNLCTSNDTCLDGVCMAGDPKPCNDGNSCTDDSCDAAMGCVFQGNTKPCDDLNACTQSDVCSDKVCSGEPLEACDDNDACTVDGCEASGGCTFFSKECGDGDPCTLDSCNSETGCDNAVDPDCTGCVVDADCTDDSKCTVGTCAPGGQCLQTAISCDDQSLCTADKCDALKGCIHLDLSAKCDDGSACTSDSCDPAVGCVHVDLEGACDDGDACTVADSCQDGACVGGLPLDCKDGNPCTDDACDAVSGCVHEANQALCDDGNECTDGDICIGGLCASGDPANCDDGNDCTTNTCNPAFGCFTANNSKPCADGNACTVNDLCNDGSCEPGAALDCDDGNECTTNACDVVTGCANLPLNQPCDDENACTLDDWCVDGACLPGPVADCNDDNGCTDDSCNSFNGCVNDANSGPCDDGDDCTQGDLCGNGECVAGDALDCDDMNPCTQDSCDPTTGCVHAALAGTCSDGNACTTGDSCQDAVCVPSGMVDCDDLDPCTIDSCLTETGCLYTALPDADGDGICDATDNCPAVRNPVQADMDGDGDGDGCDPCANGLLDSGQCDDGNSDSGDGCAEDCTVEAGWACSAAPVVTWGRDSYGLSTLPEGLGPVAALDGGPNHSVALLVDGTVAAWGRNNVGQTDVPAELTSVTAISTDGHHTLALRANGTVVGWGRNDSGESDVPDGLSGAVAVAGGDRHSLVLLADGSVVAWGLNSYGQTDVPEGLLARAVAAGYMNSAAITQVGAVVAWGRCQYQECTIPDAARTSVVAVAAGAFHFIALKSDGSVMAWGRNNLGQTDVPVAAETDVVAISAGSASSLALKANGTIVTWGSDVEGQSTVPAEIDDARVALIGSGRGHNLASLASACACKPGVAAPDCATCLDGYFGFPDCTQCPNCDDANPCTMDICNPESGCLNTPMADSDGDGVCDSVDNCDDAVNFDQKDHDGDGQGDMCDPCGDGLPDLGEACDDGNLEPEDGCDNNCVKATGWSCPDSPPVAWGNNDDGQLTIPAGLTRPVMAAGALGNSAIVQEDGTVVVWGTDVNGLVSGAVALNDVISVAADAKHMLALKADGSVEGWGLNGSGQTTIPGYLATATQVGVGANHSMALQTNGKVVVWGSSLYNVKQVPQGLNARWIATRYRTCGAVDTNGKVHIWGQCVNDVCTVPAQAKSGVIALAVGIEHAVALKSDGTVVAWGLNDEGQATVPIGLKDVVEVAAGNKFSLALKKNGKIVGWGLKDGGAISIPSGLLALTIAAGRDHALALSNQACTCSENVVGDACDSCAEGHCSYPSCTVCPKCEDGNVCNGKETVDPDTGDCLAGTPLDCDDGNACTADVCLPGPGCVHTDVAGGCADDNDCTVDSCDPILGCLFEASGLACDNGNACTQSLCAQPTTSVSSCAELDWGAGAGSAAVCAASAVGGNCSNELAFGEAMAFCTQAGARMCTVAEILADEALGTGCNYNTARGWTADSCGEGGHWTLGGAANQVASVPLRCLTGDQAVAVVRCCADAAPAALEPGCIASGGPGCFDGNDCSQDNCEVVAGCQHPLDEKSCDDGNVCTQSSCALPLTSAKSCAKLGWDAPSFGSSAVCGGSTYIDGEEEQGCSGTVDHAGATGLCHGVGGRLCTLNELLADETRGTGCGYNGALVWTSSPCGDGGYWVGPGQKSLMNSYPVSCKGAQDAAAVVRCCADTDPITPIPACLATAGDDCFDGDACSTDTCHPDQGCQQGGDVDCDDGNPCTDDQCSAATGCLWVANNLPCDDGDLCTSGDSCDNAACIGGAPTDCDDGNACTTDSCQSDSGCSHVDVSDLCDDGNACTTDTCVPATGCDNAVTSDACDDGNACTESHCGMPAASTKTCAQLSQNPSSYGSGDVCGLSQVTMGDVTGCSGEVSQPQALALCAATGARLCTLAELLADETRQTGCGYDQVPIWSSSKCGQDGFWSAAGNTFFAEAAPTRCLSLDEAGISTRCCADVAPADVEAACMASSGDDCDDDDVCTLDHCAPETGCVHTGQASNQSCDDGNACTTGICAMPEVSTSSCDELGWTGQGGGSDQVCAASTLSDGCSQRMDFDSADALCQAEGARLCTLPELLANETNNTGCSLNTARVWTSSPCGDGGAWTGPGQAAQVNWLPAMCSSKAGETYKVRCCADALPAEVEPACVPTSGPDCDDGLPCTKDSCSHKTGCQNSAVASGDSCADGNVCTDAVCADPATSVASCGDLGWSGQGGGSDAVCAQAQGIGGAQAQGCSGAVDHAEAVLLCEEAGGRLCTVAELLADEAAGTGCGYELLRNWTSTPCGSNGFWSGPRNPGGFFGTKELSCDDVDKVTRFVTCCADEAPTDVEATCLGQGTMDCDDDNACTTDFCHPTQGCIHHPMDDGTSCADENACTVAVCTPPTLSQASCNALGWTGAGAGSSDVCGNSKIVGNPPKSCAKPAEFGTAQALCTLVGARLCTVNEVMAGELLSTGCANDGKYLWTGSPCGGDGHWAAPGAPTLLETMPLTCLQDSGNYVSVGCCADNNSGGETVRCIATGGPSCRDGNSCTVDSCDPETGCVNANPGLACDDDNACTESECGIPEVSIKTCTELNWPPEAFGLTTVCGGSEGPIGPCSGYVDFNAAKALCEQGGARLCTLSELSINETRDTGCGYNSMSIWTTSPCGTGGRWTGPGTAGHPAVPVACIDEAVDDAAVVRCCADQPATHSGKTCYELGWEGQGGGGEAVCGASPSWNGPCPAPANHATSKATCEAVGARLCTLAELQADEAASTGCTYNEKRVWSGDGCEAGGFWTTAGASAFKDLHPDQCTSADSVQPVVRCCADAVITPDQPSCVATGGIPCDDGQVQTSDDCSIEQGCENSPLPGATCQGNFCYWDGVCGDNWCQYPTEGPGNCPQDCDSSCDGSADYCSLTPLEVTFAGTHRSFASVANGYVDGTTAYQTNTIIKQVADGFRYFDFDIQKCFGFDAQSPAYCMCDGACLAGSPVIDAVSVLTVFAGVLEEKDSTVVFFFNVQSGKGVTDKALKSVFEAAGLTPWLYKTPADAKNPFPVALGNMARRKQNVVVFHPAFVPRSALFETRDDYETTEPYSCGDGTGNSPGSNQFYVVNHTRVVGGDHSSAVAACANRWYRMYLVQEKCALERRVNVMAVDFHETGSGPLKIPNYANGDSHLANPYADAQGCPNCWGNFECDPDSACKNGICYPDETGTGACQPKPCTLLGVPDDCADPPHCPSGQYCGNGNCLPQKQIGESCVSHAECLDKGFCYDGACWNCWPEDPWSNMLCGGGNSTCDPDSRSCTDECVDVPHSLTQENSCDDDQYCSSDEGCVACKELLSTCKHDYECCGYYDEHEFGSPHFENVCDVPLHWPCASDDEGASCTCTLEISGTCLINTCFCSSDGLCVEKFFLF